MKRTRGLGTALSTAVSGVVYVIAKALGMPQTYAFLWLIVASVAAVLGAVGWLVVSTLRADRTQRRRDAPADRRLKDAARYVEVQHDPHL